MRTGLEKLNPHSPVRECLSWLERSGNEALFAEKYQAVAAENAAQPGPFLSVVIRSQGKRPDMLQDVFLCLQAQEDRDFEVILIGHNADDAGWAALEELVRLQAEDFSRRVRMTRLAEGSRGAPLNLGFALARGEYAVVLDDDDLVFDTWVKDFHEALPGHEGMILHAGAYTQPWKTLPEDPEGRTGLTADGTTGDQYCREFRTLRQQSLNFCPFMGLAFPLILFRDLHICFDETLTTTEDWDFLLRTAGIAGVHDLPESTAIYRLWNTRDASRALHRREEWMRNYRTIIRRVAEDPLILPGGEARRFRLEEAGMLGDEDKGRSAFLKTGWCYWTKSDEEEYSEKRGLEAPVRYEALREDDEERAQQLARIELEFLPGEKQADTAGIRWLRISPAREGLFTLEDPVLELTWADGKTARLTDRQVAVTNALREGSRFLFLTEDPMLSFRLAEGQPLARAVFRAVLHYHCLPAMEAWVRDIFADGRWADGHRNMAHLYWDLGDGYSERNGLAQTDVIRGDRFRAVFRLPEEVHPRALRIDPTMVELMLLEEVRIELARPDGSVRVVPQEEWGWTNGFLVPGGLACPGRIPYVELPMSGEENVAEVRVTGRIRFLSPEEMEAQLARAIRVPDYASVFRELRAQQRKKIWERPVPAEEENE